MCASWNKFTSTRIYLIHPRAAYMCQWTGSLLAQVIAWQLPAWCQAITWTNTNLLLIGPLGTNFSEIRIKILTFSTMKMHLKMSSVKWRPFCPGGDELIIMKWGPQCHDSIIYIPWEQGLWGQHGAHMGPTGPRWAPCWSHESCYLGKGHGKYQSISIKLYYQIFVSFVVRYVKYNYEVNVLIANLFIHVLLQINIFIVYQVSLCRILFENLSIFWNFRWINNIINNLPSTIFSIA